jgi:hypothetical protein
LPTITRSTFAMTLSPTCWMLLIGLPVGAAVAAGFANPAFVGAGSAVR